MIEPGSACTAESTDLLAPRFAARPVDVRPGAGEFDCIGFNPHGKPERARGLFLAIHAVAGVERDRRAREPEPDRSALTAAFLICCDGPASRLLSLCH